MPDLRRLILLSVVSVLASLAVTASASAAELFTNSSPIKIPASGTFGVASPYPSEIAVSGMTGPVTEVNVTLHRVGHAFPADIAVPLVSPSGDTVTLMRSQCGIDPIEDFTWIFDQQHSVPMPTFGPCPDFVYRPNPNNSFNDVFPAPAPAGPHGVSLDDFNNENPNGTWKLFVRDDNEDDVGDIKGGWSLSIDTGPVDVAIPGSGTSGPAIPYPATRTISVSDPTRVIADLNVSIDGISHERPDDLDLLLVGPQGQKVILMSDACGSFGVSAYGWVWDDEAAAPMPEGNGTDVCGTRFHRPANYGSGDFWPAPAPASPYATTLSAFDGTDPNGEWRLFVNDDAAGNTGFFTNRFQLQITTVARPNNPPVARDNSYRGKEDRTLRVPARGVLRNDTDADGDALRASVVSRPKKGKLVLKPNGAFTYKPRKNFNGTVRFVYRASDGHGDSDTARVSIRIKARPR